MFMSSSMEAAIHLGLNHLANSEIYKNTKIRGDRKFVQHYSKVGMEHSEEILNVKCLQYSSPSWARSVSSQDQAIKWAKAKVCVHADSVLCVGQMKDSPGAMQRWKGQVEGLRLYSSYQDAVRIDGEAIEFERKHSQDSHHCLFFKRSRKTWRERTSSPQSSRTESSLYQCSMTLSGKEWWDLYFECRKSQELRDEIPARTSRVGREVVWKFFLRSKRWMGFHSQQNGTAIQRNWSSCVQKHQCLESWNRTMHFNGDSMNTELLFQTIHSVNQLSIYGAVAKWCHQFCLTEEEKGRATFSVDNKMLTSLQPEGVQLLVSPATAAPGNRMRENVFSFEGLASRLQLTQSRQKTYFQYRVTAGKQYKIRPDGDDGWRTITHLCREYTFSRSFPKSQVLVAIPEGTITGPVLEVQIVKIIDGYGKEIAIPSTVNPSNTSYVVISRETERCVKEIHDHKEELRSSNELLTAERGSNSSQETGALNSIKETWASFPSNPVGDSLFKKTVIPWGERKWITIDANPSPRSGLLTGIRDGHEDGSSLQSRWTRRKRIISLGSREITIAERICTGKSKIIFWQVLDSSASARQQ